ncbi:MAG: peptidyl-prolyl cis-trans isomerase [Bdellovibrionales bacterium]|nr:peptidyl-prolyl cis-trans isomerase [Bdellovibrionales bacterium]
MPQKAGPAIRMAGLFIFLASFSACSPSCTPSPQNFSNRTIIKVNDTEMSSSDFAQQLADHLKDYDALAVKEDRILEKAKHDVIRDFIIRTLTEEWAKENKILLKKEEIEATINNVRSQYPDDLSFRQKLIEDNQTFDEWSEKVKFSLLQKKVMDTLIASAEAPSEEEMKTYYDSNKDVFKKPEQIHLRQIVLKTENDAKTVLAELQKDKKMKDLAGKFSITPEAMNQGDLGWVDRGILDIFDQLFDKKNGYMSGVLKSPYGYHIIEVIDKRRASTPTLDEVKDQIKAMLMQNREQAVYSKWLEAQIRKAKVLKDEAFIENIKIETRGEN